MAPCHDPSASSLSISCSPSHQPVPCPQKMEKMCNVLLSTLKADKDRKAAARKAEKEKSEAMRLEELARREAQAQQVRGGVGQTSMCWHADGGSHPSTERRALQTGTRVGLRQASVGTARGAVDYAMAEQPSLR